MHTFLLRAATAAALIMGAGVAHAQQGAPGSMRGPGTMMQDRGGQSEAARPGGRMVDGDASGPGVMGRGMMGPGMMGPGMMAMMMVMMDADGDGALSLQEVQAIHSRMFNYVDANKDGKVTPEELQGFFGGRRGGPN